MSEAATLRRSARDIVPLERRAAESAVSPAGDRGTVLAIGHAAELAARRLRAPGHEQVVELSDLAAVIGARLQRLRGSEAAGLLVFRIRCARSDARQAELVLGDHVASSAGWLLGVAEGSFGLVIEAMQDDVARRGEALGERLRSWGIGAELETLFVAAREAGAADAVDRVLPFLQGDAPLRLRGGAVLFHDESMRALHRTVLRVAPASVSVLILGETGVGKDVIASMLHDLSPRAKAPFLRLPCASLSEALLESELSGHRLSEGAEGGTVFLDEVGDLSSSLQAKLLLLLASAEASSLGAAAPCPTNVRFVAATHRDLAREVALGRFRADLFYRLSGVTLTVPALRHRPAEIPLLARQFLASAVERFGCDRLAISGSALTTLQDHAWPGNIRELRNAIERAVLLATDGVVQSHHLGLGPAPLEPAGGSRSAAPGAAVPSLKDRLRGEREELEVALARSGGNQSRTAEILGVSRRTVVRKIAKFGLPRPRALLAGAGRR